MGRPGAVARLVRGATECFCQHVQQEAKMKVNANKLEVLACSDNVRAELLACPHLRAALRRQTRNLGVDYARGRRMGHAVQRKRA